MEVLYFGCIGTAGHFLHNKRGNHQSVEKTPWGSKIDTILCPEDTRKQGASKLHHKDGWTALAFWDYSVDQRPGSNSVFFAEGTHTFSQMGKIARNHFGQIFERFDFTILREN